MAFFRKGDHKINVSTVKLEPKGERKMFRIKFVQQLEASFTILEIDGEKVNTGSAKILIQDMGPGGLCFISNLNMPIKEENAVLQFITNLIGEEITVRGYLIWKEKFDDNNNLYKYGVEFMLDENERADLIRILNQVQIKMENNMLLFNDGSFVLKRPTLYFKSSHIA